MLNSLATACLFLSLWLPLVHSTNVTASCQRVQNTNTADISNTTYVNLVRSAKLPSGTTYRYVFSPPFDAEKPYLLFLHGFPDSSYGWHHQITYFTEQGYGVIVPDLLGYGGTDNPSDLRAFNFKRMAEELAQLLDCEGIDTVIGIARDFGTPLLSRLINYQSSRLSAVAFLNNGYFPPQGQLDEAGVGVANNATEALFGFQTIGFYFFFNEDDAGTLIDQHQESFYSIAYTRNTSLITRDFSPVGALQRWLLQDRIASDLFVSRVSIEQWKEIIGAQGGFDGPLKWYKAIMRGFNNPDSEDLNSSGIITQPALLMVGDRDPSSIASQTLNDTLPYTSNVRVRTVNTGHFMQLEAPHEVNKHLDLFIQDVMKIPESGSDSVAVYFEDCQRANA